MDLRDLDAVQKAVDQALEHQRLMDKATAKFRDQLALHDIGLSAKALSAIAAEGALMDKAMKTFATDALGSQKLMSIFAADLSKMHLFSEQSAKALAGMGLSVKMRHLTDSLGPHLIGANISEGIAKLTGDVQKVAEQFQVSIDAMSKFGTFSRLSLFPDSVQIGKLMAGLMSVPTVETTALAELAAQTSLEYLPWDTLGEKVGMSGRARRRLRRSTERLQRSYTELTRAAVPSEDQTDDRVEADAHVGVLAHGQALRLLTNATTDTLVIGVRVDVVQATFEIVEASLSLVNDAWVEMLRGARERAVTRGPDWPRHWAASYRQLLKNVLHKAAPSDVVKKWDPSDLDSKGFPTRRTKVRWLCRHEPKEQRAFRVDDIDSALGILKVLDDGVHDDELEIDVSEFHWLSIRIEKALHDILQRCQDGRHPGRPTT